MAWDVDDSRLTLAGKSDIIESCGQVPFACPKLSRVDLYYDPGVNGSEVEDSVIS